MGNQIKWLEHDTNGQSWCSSTKVMGNLKCRELQLHRLFWWKKCTQFNDFFYGTLPKNQQVISFLKATMKRAKNIFMIVKFLLLCILFLTCFFFVKSVFQDFASRTSSMKRSLKKFDKVKFPTILHCTDPAIKASAIEKYEKFGCDITPFNLDNFINNECQNQSVEKVLNDCGYTIDEDFELFMFSSTSSWVKISVFLFIVICKFGLIPNFFS